MKISTNSEPKTINLLSQYPDANCYRTQQTKLFILANFILLHMRKYSNDSIALSLKSPSTTKLLNEIRQTQKEFSTPSKKANRIACALTMLN